MDKPKVLIVDDNPDDVFLLNRALFKCDVKDVFAVTPAAKATPLLGELSKGQAAQVPDVIFVDVETKGVDGLELVRKLRAEPLLEQVPIIVLSDRINRGKRNDALGVGCQRILRETVRLRRVARHCQKSVKGLFQKTGAARLRRRVVYAFSLLCWLINRSPSLPSLGVSIRLPVLSVCGVSHSIQYA